MLSAKPIDMEYMSKIGYAMGCIAFSDEELIASLSEIRPDLETVIDPAALVAVLETDQARVAMAGALALAAALQGIADSSNLEQLMHAVGFIDEEDDQDVRSLKGVALDKALLAAIDMQRQSALCGEEAARLNELRTRAARVLQSCGYADAYYKDKNLVH